MNLSSALDEIVDFVPLIKVLWDLSGLKAESKLPRKLVASSLPKGWFPLGAKKHANGKGYIQAAVQRGYVTVGMHDRWCPGTEWIQTTGKMEALRGSEWLFDQVVTVLRDCSLTVHGRTTTSVLPDM